jgi:hypothetical protein
MPTVQCFCLLKIFKSNFNSNPIKWAFPGTGRKAPGFRGPLGPGSLPCPQSWGGRGGIQTACSRTPLIRADFTWSSGVFMHECMSVSPRSLSAKLKWLLWHFYLASYCCSEKGFTTFLTISFMLEKNLPPVGRFKKWKSEGRRRG